MYLELANVAAGGEEVKCLFVNKGQFRVARFLLDTPTALPLIHWNHRVSEKAGKIQGQEEARGKIFYPKGFGAAFVVKGRMGLDSGRSWPNLC